MRGIWVEYRRHCLSTGDTSPGTMSAFGHGYPNHVLIKGIEHFVEKAVG